MDYTLYYIFYLLNKQQMKNLELTVKRSSSAIQKIEENNLEHLSPNTPKKQKIISHTSTARTAFTNLKSDDYKVKTRIFTPDIVHTQKNNEMNNKQRYFYSSQVKNKQATGQNIRQRQEQVIKKVPQYFQYTNKIRTGSQNINQKLLINFQSTQYDIPSNNNQESRVKSKEFHKSNLQLDLSRFKWSTDGNLVKTSNRKPVQQALFKVKQIKPRNGQVFILNAHKLQQVMGKQFRSLEQFLDNPETEEIIIDYFNENGHLQQGENADVAFNFFHQLCFVRLGIKFNHPLIKKYKNCIFYGEKPHDSASSVQVCTYEGFLYYYGSRLYIGQFKQGKKNGKGFQILFSKNTFSCGTFKNGAKSGFFKIEKKGQYRYEGEVVNGVFEGKGILTTKFSRYEGNFQEGYKNGTGQQFFYLTEQSYFGQYLNGVFQGRGQIRAPNYYFKGYFKSNLKQQEGYQKTQNQQYKGNFTAGKRDGYGILIFKNGDTYKGEFKNGQMHGKGQIKYKNGINLIGNFVNNRMVSQHKETKYQQKYIKSSSQKNEQKSIISDLKINQQYEKITPQLSVNQSCQNQLQQQFTEVPHFKESKFTQTTKQKIKNASKQSPPLAIKNQKKQQKVQKIDPKEQQLQKQKQKKVFFKQSPRKKIQQASKIPLLDVGDQDFNIIRRRRK